MTQRPLFPISLGYFIFDSMRIHVPVQFLFDAWKKCGSLPALIAFFPERYMRRVFIIPFVLLAIFFGISMYYALHSPARVPTHFGLNGVPDHWEDGSLMTWLTFPLIALGGLAVLFGSAVLMRRHPKMINIGNKAVFLSLPPEKQEAVFGILDRMLAIISSSMVVLFAVLQFLSFRMANGGSSQLPSVFIATAFGEGLVIIITVAISAGQVEDAVKKAARG